MARYIKALLGLTLAFLLWIATLGAVIWYEAGATIEQAQQAHGDEP